MMKNSMTDQPSTNATKVAELEDLCGRQLSTNGMQHLDGAVSAPTSMMDWEAKQRAWKKQDRQKKNQSKEILSKYRGKEIKTSDHNLTNLRKEEKKMKKEAEQQLHNYGRAPPVHVDAMVQEEECGGLANHSSPASSDSGVMVQNGNGNGNVNGNGSGNSEQDETIAAANLGSMGMLVVEAKCEATPAVLQDDWVTVLAEDDFYEEAPFEPAPTSEATATAPPIQLPVPPIVVPPAADPVLLVTPPSIPESSPPVLAAEPSTISSDRTLRIDVAFSFGLLSNHVVTTQPPSLNKYLQAVAEIVQSTIGIIGKNASAKQLQEHVPLRYDPNFPPFVRDIVTDVMFTPSQDQNDVKRYMVYAAVPIFLSKPSNGRNSQIDTTSTNAIYLPLHDALKSAVQGGTFLIIANRLEEATA